MRRQGHETNPFNIPEVGTEISGKSEMLIHLGDSGSGKMATLPISSSIAPVCRWAIVDRSLASAGDVDGFPGVQRRAEAVDFTDEDIDAVIDINVKATLVCVPLRAWCRILTQSHVGFVPGVCEETSGGEATWFAVQFRGTAFAKTCPGKIINIASIISFIGGWVETGSFWICLSQDEQYLLKKFATNWRWSSILGKT
jgi:NAD(P)-dependent dehydrogenase (short-subunit alcohol dehydrogenase family)